MTRRGRMCSQHAVTWGSMASEGSLMGTGCLHSGEGLTWLCKPQWGPATITGVPQPSLSADDIVVRKFLGWDRSPMVSDKVPA